jgi:transposase
MSRRECRSSRNPGKPQELTRTCKADYHVDRFSYAIGERARAAAGRFDGKLVLLTNSNDFKLEQTVERYTSLADFGYGFRGLESDLDIAPVCHRLPDRIRAHGLICFLALVLHRVMRLRLKACGSTACPKTALEIPRRLPKHRVHISSKHLGGTGRIRPKQLEMFVALRLTKPA